jgi:hypothetical protein
MSDQKTFVEKYNLLFQETSESLDPKFRMIDTMGSLKNNFAFWKPIHPVRLRPGNTAYA